jgi:hypothetical protein
LLAQLAPDIISSDDLEQAFKERDYLKRAEMVLNMAEKLGCRKFVTPEDIVDVRISFFVFLFLLNLFFIIYKLAILNNSYFRPLSPLQILKQKKST